MYSELLMELVIISNVYWAHSITSAIQQASGILAWEPSGVESTGIAR